MNEPIEIICGYAVHPAAAMFPLIEGDEFDLLVDSIARNGMHHPIVLRGNQLLDGRNRLRAVEAAREQGYKVSIPTIQWTDDKTSVSEWIWDTNATRRQLTDDGLAMASAAVWPLIASENAERKKASQFTQGESGNVKGRPIGKEQVTTKTSSPVNRDRKASDAHSTVGQVAAKAKTSIHKARQAVAVQKAIEDGTIPADTAKAVMAGKKKLKDVAPKKPREKKAKPFDGPAAGDRLHEWLREELDKWPEPERHKAAHWIRLTLREDFYCYWEHWYAARSVFHQ